jgi:hypothetical protein
MRASYSTSAASLALLEKDAKVTLLKEVFTKSGSSTKKSKWFYLSSGGKKGYVRADCVDSIRYSAVAAATNASGINYRSGPSVNMKKLGTLGKGAAVEVRLEAVYRNSSELWYSIRSGNDTGYIRADLLKLKTGTSGKSQSEKSQSEKSKSEKSKKAKIPQKNDIKLRGVSKPVRLTTGEGFGLRGTLSYNGTIDRVVVGIKDDKGKWVSKKSTKLGSGSYDISDADSSIRFGTLRSGIYRYRINVVIGKYTVARVNHQFEVVRCKEAANLMKKATDGGKARYVGTFNSSNCTRLFAVKGAGAARVPQGMTFANGKYYLVYGLEAGQAVVTYSRNGAKLDVVQFPFNIVHPNGIAWNPNTKKCYIFRGYSYYCYTYDPAAKKFGKVKIPYSSSGVSYDKSTDRMYVSSKTGIRVYSGNGKFTHKTVFDRCTHKGTSYVQDCASARGFIFHCVSGSNKHGTNYLDVYRSNGKYLGTIKTNLDELESVIIDKDGFIQLLSNTVTTTDYIWRTPLNINDLK